MPPTSPPQQQGAPPDRGVVDIALDISFGNLGYYLELARPFDKVSNHVKGCLHNLERSNKMMQKSHFQLCIFDRTWDNLPDH